MVPYLRKPVRRLTKGIAREAGKNRNVIIILRPPNIIGFRAKGCRTEYQLTAEVGYTMAVRAHVATKEKDRKRIKKIKRNVRK